MNVKADTTNYSKDDVIGNVSSDDKLTIADKIYRTLEICDYITEHNAECPISPKSNIVAS